MNLHDTITDRPAQLAKEIAVLARDILGPAVEVMWFGSWPQRKARQYSDLDIAVSVGAAISPAQMARLRDAIEDLPTLFEVDLVDLHVVGRALRDEILKHGVRL
jgi:predicted nucleotidyltransferase